MKELNFFFFIVTPQAGFEPATFRLTADGSTIELLRSSFVALRVQIFLNYIYFFKLYL